VWCELFELDCGMVAKTNKFVYKPAKLWNSSFDNTWCY